MMNLYSGTTCPFSHRCRIVLFEKGMDFQVIDVDMFNKPEEMAAINPHNRVPVLVERDLVLFEPNIINEYVDERFPHPQLMPADPIMRAKARQLLHVFEKEIFSHMEVLEISNDEDALQQARTHIRDQLLQLPVMSGNIDYHLGTAFSMLDVALAPLLWRLTYYGITMPRSAAPLLKYAERIFSRQGFIDALTPAEKIMRR